jgi:branched-chain amino acid transport system ATP-binding protein
VAALDVRDVVAGYSAKVDALNGVSLKLDEREAVAVLGANGAGKTTLLRTISGLLSARRGSVHVFGADVTGKSPDRIARSGVAHVPEGRQIFVRQTVEENLKLGGMGSDRQQERREQLLEVFPTLAEKLHQPAGQLSGGQQQMLAIARGLMSSPSLLMLDEPSLGLSPKLVDDMIELLQGLRAELELTLLLVEQNAAVAAGVADRAYVLRLGEVVLERSAADLLGSDEVLAAYLG